MGLLQKKIQVDIDGDKKPDFQLDLKTIIIVITGIVSLTMTYTTLQKDIEEAKRLPPIETHDVIDNKIIVLEKEIEMLQDQYGKRLDKIEDKVYKR
jgi:hypothetical protein|tara:strand:- start:606 stop:893 length:288 start_codon:yes stop_codon:yes gene_type:complete